jgi:hypothetical protein
MTAYFIAFALPLVLYPLRKRSRILYVFLLAGAWALFAGLRNGIGGNDYYVYQDFYGSISGAKVGLAYYFEPLFLALAIGTKAIGLSYHGFLCVVALLGTLPAVYVIDRRCEESALGLYVYGMEWMLYASFVILRQSIALGIAYLALDALFDRKRLRFLCLAVLAGLFHNSAFVLLPLVFFTGELNPRTRSALLFATAALFLLLEGGAAFGLYAGAQGIAARLLKFIGWGAYERLNPLNVLEILLFWFLIARYAGDSKPLERNLYLLYTCVALLAVGHAVIIRFGYYYELALAFLFPQIAYSKKASALERFLLVGFIAAYFLAKTFRWLALNGGDLGGFLPYRTILF